jgi:hypothetical protein
MQYLQFDTKAVNTLTEVHFLYEALLRFIQKVFKSTLLDCKKLLICQVNEKFHHVVLYRIHFMVNGIRSHNLSGDGY